MALLRRARKDTSMAALVADHQRHIALEGDGSQSDSDGEQKQEHKPPQPLLRRPQHPLVLDPFDERDEERGGDDDDDYDEEEEEEWPASDRSRQSPPVGRVVTAQYYRHDTDDDDDNGDSTRRHHARAAGGRHHHPRDTSHAHSPSSHYEQHHSVRFSEADTITCAGSDENTTPDSQSGGGGSHQCHMHESQHALYHYSGPRQIDKRAKNVARGYAAVTYDESIPDATGARRPLRPGAKVSSALRKPMQLMRERTSAHRRTRFARSGSSHGVAILNIAGDADLAFMNQSASSGDASNGEPHTGGGAGADADELGLVKVDAAMIEYIDKTLVKPDQQVFNRYTRFFLDAALERLYQEYTAVKWFPRARWHIALLILVHVLVLLLFCVLPSSGFHETDQFVLASAVATTYVQWTYLLAALPFALLPNRWNPFQKRWRVWACLIVVLFNWTFQLWLAHAGHLALEQFTDIVDAQLECSAVNVGRAPNVTRTVRANANGSAIGNSNSTYIDVGSSWSGAMTQVNVTRPFTDAELASKTYTQREYIKVSTQLYAGALTQILTGFAWLFSFIFVISIRLEFVYVVVVSASAVATYACLVLAFALEIEWMTTFAYSFALALLVILSRSADLTNRRSFLSTFVVERENESLQSSLHRAEAALMNEPAGEKEKEVVEQVLDVPEMRAVEAFRIPFADLKFLEAIGRGAMGDVIKAKYLGTVVVCKRIRREHITEATLESFREEIVLMACLRHPNIVQFIGASWDNYSNLCIVMEYLENGDMHSVLNSTIGKSFTWADPLLKMALDIVQGMLYLHSQEPPIVHRDLKSVNVLCSKTYGCNVGDFGLSRRYNRGDVNPLKTLVGTPFWLAPEIIRQDRYGPAADIYSFGIVLTELETRKTPYHELGEVTHHGVKVLMRIAYDGLRPTLPPTCLPNREQLITDCLLADPAQRPTFAEILTRLQGDVQREIEEEATRATLIERRTMLKQSHAALT